VRQVSERALDAASAAGATYADCRVINRTVQKLTVKNGMVAAVELLEDEGVGIRVIVDGAWGFASVDVLDSPSVEEAARHAVQIARASARVNRVAVRLAPAPALTGVYRTPVVRDPFAVSLDDKVDLLLRTDAAMSNHPQIQIRECSLEFVREQLGALPAGDARVPCDALRPSELVVAMERGARRRVTAAEPPRGRCEIAHRTDERARERRRRGARSGRR